jgi:hypothetical protein
MNESRRGFLGILIGALIVFGIFSAISRDRPGLPSSSRTTTIVKVEAPTPSPPLPR